MMEQEIRDAIAAGDYVGAASLFDRHARALAPTEANLADLAALLQWTRTTVLCERAHSEAELSALRVALAYAR